MHRTIAVTFAAVLVLGSTSAGFAQGTGGGPPSEKPPSGGPAHTLADIKEETEAGVAYQPCPANVRFPNGQQMCLGLPGNPSYRPYTSPK